MTVPAHFDHASFNDIHARLGREILENFVAGSGIFWVYIYVFINQFAVVIK